MQDLFYSIPSSSLAITTEKGYSYTMSDVTLLIKPDTGSFVAVSSSLEVAYFPISNTNLFYKYPDSPATPSTGSDASSFYWNLDIPTTYTVSPLNYLLASSSIQTYVSQSTVSNSGLFNVPSGSYLYMEAQSNISSGNDLSVLITDKTDNYVILNDQYVTPMLINFAPTSSHYYEMKVSVTNNL